MARAFVSMFLAATNISHDLLELQVDFEIFDIGMEAG